MISDLSVVLEGEAVKAFATAHGAGVSTGFWWAMDLGAVAGCSSPSDCGSFWPL